MRHSLWLGDQVRAAGIVWACGVAAETLTSRQKRFFTWDLIPKATPTSEAWPEASSVTPTTITSHTGQRSTVWPSSCYNASCVFLESWLQCELYFKERVKKCSHLCVKKLNVSFLHIRIWIWMNVGCGLFPRRRKRSRRNKCQAFRAVQDSGRNAYLFPTGCGGLAAPPHLSV